MIGTCRICHKSDSGLIMYAARHYVHPECGLIRWGAKFFDRLRPFQLKDFPFLLAKRHGAADDLVKRIKAVDTAKATGA